MKVTVQLQGKDRTTVELQVDRELLNGSNVLVHRGRYYVYGGMDSHLRMRFNETNPPVTLP